MKMLHILLIVILIGFLVTGGIVIHNIYNLYRYAAVPHKIYAQKIYPYQLFEVVCFVTTAYTIRKFFIGDYKWGVYISFAAVMLSSLFFSLN